MQKPTPLSKDAASNPLSLICILSFSTALSVGVCRTFFAYAFAAISISHNFSSDTFWFVNCECKKSISAKKCVSINLYLIGCFGLIYTISLPPGSSILSCTLTDRFFLPLRGLSCLSDSFSSNFSCGFLMLFLSLHQVDASGNGTWMPTSFRQFFYAPATVLPLPSPHTFCCPHLL